MKKILSILLSIAVLFSALTVLAGISFTASADTATNLLTNPNFDGYYYDETAGKYVASGWDISSKATISTDTDGSNVVTIETTNTNSEYSVRTNKDLALNATKYYKFSIMYKLEDPASGGFNITNKVYFGYRYNNTVVNRVNFSKTSEWTEASFVMYGGDVSSGAWTRSFNITSNFSCCKLSVKNPSVVEYDPDALEYTDTEASENLLTNGDFSVYDAETNTVENLMIDNAPFYVGHTVEKVEINGEEKNALKVTVTHENNERKIRMTFDYKKMDKTKSYTFTAWMKLENCSSTNSFSNNGKDGRIHPMFYHANVTNRASTEYEEKAGWQKIEFVIDSTVHNGADWWIDGSNKFGVGLNVYGMTCDIYLADMCLKETIGNIAVENAENMLTGGDLSNYDEETNTFADFKIETNGTWYGGHTRELVTIGNKEMNAVKVTINKESENRRAKVLIDGNKIKKNRTYKFSAWVKLENNSTTGTFNNDSKIGAVRLYFHHGTKNNVSTDFVQTKDGWQKLEFIVDESVHKNETWWDLHEFAFGIQVYDMVCDLYVADLRVEEIAGGSEERSGGFIEVNRNTAKSGNTVQVKVSVDDGFTLKRIYYTDGVTETEITAKKQSVFTEREATDPWGKIHNGTIYTSVASDMIYEFAMPIDENITIKADYIYYLYGDVNGDRVNSILDLVRLKKHSAGESVEIIAENLDLTEEAISGDYLVVIRRILLGLPVEEEVAVASVDSLTTLTENFQ